jgi:hypothetical protein
MIGLATLIATVAAWLGIAIVMSAINVEKESGVGLTGLATGAQMTHNFALWWQSVAVLGNGNFFGMSVTLTSTLAVVCAALSIGAVLLIPRICRGEIRQLTPIGPATWATPRRALLAFWSSSAVLLSLVFIVGQAPVDITANRYLIGLIYAVAVVIPVAASGRFLTEALAVGGTVFVALSGTIAMARGTVVNFTAGLPSSFAISKVEDVAAREHLRIGYAGYWDASPMSWTSHFRISVFPVQSCYGGSQVCAFFVHTISSWYTPRANLRTFILVDPTLPYLQTEPAVFGKPVAAYHIDELTMYVYPYDVASRIRPNHP